jgi:outer membrane immunogenic protein
MPTISEAFAMNRLPTYAVAIATLIGTPAFAADMAVRALPPAPAPVSPWTGWYVGGNAGWGWGNTQEVTNSVVNTFCNPVFSGCNPAPVTTDAFVQGVQSFDVKANGFIGGGQVGYNLQNGNAVAGIEADFQGADIKGTASFANSVAIANFPGLFLNTSGSGSQKLEWLGTVRGRVGWLPTPLSLFYVTGGLAYGHPETNISFTASQTPGGCVPTCVATVSSSNSTTRFGFTVGGGWEWMFAPQWSFNAEYLYYTLGHVTLNTAISVPFQGTPYFGCTFQSTAVYDGSIARGGLNYHF